MPASSENGGEMEGHFWILVFLLILPSEVSSYPDINYKSWPTGKDKKDSLTHTLVALATIQVNATMYTNTRTLICTQKYAYFHTCKHVAQTTLWGSFSELLGQQSTQHTLVCTHKCTPTHPWERLNEVC